MRRSFRVWLAAVILTGLAIAAWAFWLEPASLRVRSYRLELPGWPRELAGTRVAVLTDLHIGSPFNGLGKLDRAVAMTNASRPDLILLPGDFVIHGVPGGRVIPPEPIAMALSHLEAPLGVYAVLGNHDWWYGGTRVLRALRAAGIRVLEDEALPIDRGRTRFWLGGVSDYWERAHDFNRTIAQAKGAAPILLMTHNPDIFPLISAPYALLIAGHTHGGQVWLPWIGRPVVPSKYGQRYAIGHVAEDGRDLFVSPGVGTSILPVRFLVPPEISLLDLEPLETAAGSRSSR